MATAPAIARPISSAMPMVSGRIANGASGMRVGGGAAKRWASIEIQGSLPASHARVAAR